MKKYRVVVHFRDLLTGESSMTKPRYRNTLEKAIDVAKGQIQKGNVPGVVKYIKTDIQEFEYVRTIPVDF